MGLCLGLRGLLPGALQALGHVGIGGLTAHQQGARFIGHQNLGAQLFVEVFDLLGPGQQTRLLGIGCIEVNTVPPHRMTTFDIDKLSGLQHVTAGQRFFKAGGGERALQPVIQHSFLAGIVGAQQVC